MPSGSAKPLPAMATLKAASVPRSRTTTAATPGCCPPPRAPDHQVIAAMTARIAADGGSSTARKASAKAAMPQGLKRPGNAQQTMIEATIHPSQESSRTCISGRVAGAEARLPAEQLQRVADGIDAQDVLRLHREAELLLECHQELDVRERRPAVHGAGGGLLGDLVHPALERLGGHLQHALADAAAVRLVVGRRAPLGDQARELRLHHFPGRPAGQVLEEVELARELFRRCVLEEMRGDLLFRRLR